MTLPEIPKALKNAFHNLGPDMHEYVSSMDGLVEIALSGLGLQDVATVLPFLDEMLSGRYSPEDLKDMWWRTPATFVFLDGGDIAEFLSRMRRALLSPPFSPG